MKVNTNMSSDKLKNSLPAENEAAEAALELERGPGEKEAFNLLISLSANPT